MSSLLLGIDGGGTKTVARLAHAETDDRPLCVIGTGFAGGSNPYSVGWDAAVRDIGQAANAARANAGITDVPGVAILAVAGCATESARQRLQREAAAAGIAEVVHVAPDTAPLLSAATPGRPAVGVIAGTGSIAVGRDSTGDEVTVGGWGYLIDDAGSGYSLGQVSLRALCRAEDAGRLQASRLFPAVCHQLAIGSLGELKQLIYESPDPRARIASLATEVIRAAKDGDALALSIAIEGADSLAELADACARRVDQPDASTEFFVAGGLLIRSPFYRRLLTTALHNRRVGARVRLAPDAACGCLQIARRAVAENPPLETSK